MDGNPLVFIMEKNIVLNYDLTDSNEYYDSEELRTLGFAKTAQPNLRLMYYSARWLPGRSPGKCNPAEGRFVQADYDTLGFAKYAQPNLRNQETQYWLAARNLHDWWTLVGSAEFTGS